MIRLVEIDRGEIVIAVPEYHCRLFSRLFTLAARGAMEPVNHVHVPASLGSRYDLVAMASAFAMFFEVAETAAQVTRFSLSEVRKSAASYEATYYGRIAEQLREEGPPDDDPSPTEPKSRRPKAA